MKTCTRAIPNPRGTSMVVTARSQPAHNSGDSAVMISQSSRSITYGVASWVGVGGVPVQVGVGVGGMVGVQVVNGDSVGMEDGKACVRDGSRGGSRVAVVPPA